MEGLDFSRIKICGREGELKQLKAAFRRITSSTDNSPPCETILIEGAAGRGKSALVDAFAASIRPKSVCASHHQKFIFASGKFDESSDEPLSGITHMLESLIHGMLLENDAHFWTSSLEDSLRRSELRSLAMIYPAIRENLMKESLEDETCSSIGVVDEKNTWGFERLRLSLRTLIRTVCRCMTLVIVLDDLQWMDEASLSLIETFAFDKLAQNLLFVAIYRNSEDTLGTVSKLKTQATEVHATVICLNNLDLNGVVDMLVMVLRRDEEDVQPLAILIHRRTGGNAFFVIQFLQLLERQKLVYYSATSYRWEWVNLDQIVRETEIADNVLEMVSDKILDMPNNLQVSLKSAACLGPMQFDAEILRHSMIPLVQVSVAQSMLSSDEEDVVSVSATKLLQALDLGISEGLLEKLGAPRKYKFAHDRIRESAFLLLPDGDERKQLHLSMGRQLRDLLESDDATQAEENLRLLAVHHLNIGFEMVTDSNEKQQLVELTLEAAQIMFERSLFSKATEYLCTCLSLLDLESCWTHHYDTSLQIHTSLAHVLLCHGRWEESQAMSSEVLDHAKTLNDSLGANRSYILCLLNSGRIDDAIERNISVLKKLGVKIPSTFLPYHIAKNALKLKKALRQLSDEELLSLPPMKDEMHKAASTFMDLLAEVATMAAKKKFMIIAKIKSILFTLEHGHCEQTALCLAAAAYLHMGISDLKGAFRYSQISMQMAQECNNPKQDAKAMLICYCFVEHWRKPLADCLEPLLRAAKILRDSGNVEYMGLSMIGYFFCYYNCGLGLEPLEKDMARAVQTMEDYSQQHQIMATQSLLRLVLSLTGRNVNPMEISQELMPDEDACVKRYVSVGNKRALSLHYLCIMFRGVFFCNLSLAQKASKKLYHPSVEGPTPFLPARFLFQGLVATRMFRRTGSRFQEWRAWTFLRKLAKIAKRGNMNAVHMMLLLKAECKSLHQQNSSVQKSYDTAIVSAARAGVTHHQALANECAGEYFLRQNDRSWASTYLTRAWECYGQWGARAKSRHLEEIHGELLDSSTTSQRFSVLEGGSLRARTRFDDTCIPSNLQN